MYPVVGRVLEKLPVGRVELGLPMSEAAAGNNYGAFTEMTELSPPSGLMTWTRKFFGVVL